MTEREWKIQPIPALEALYVTIYRFISKICLKHTIPDLYEYTPDYICFIQSFEADESISREVAE